MPTRRTLRGAERTPLARDADVLVCGASFAGLAVARELAGSGARVLVLDRYEIGERQTSACGIPTEWLRAMDLMGSHRQEFGRLVVHTPHGTARLELPWTFSTFDYPELCALLWEQSDADFETAKVHGRTGDTVHTDRGDLTAPLVVDALGWRRVLGGGPGRKHSARPSARGSLYQPPDAPLSRGLEVHPHGSGDEMEIWIDPRFHVKDTTVLLAEDIERDPVRYQGNWIPHRLRSATEDGVFFVGDSAGHCLPLTAEGIRTAFYFGMACGRELRAVVEGRTTAAEALARYGDFSDSHRWKFESMLAAQRLVPRVPPRLLAGALKGMQWRRFVDWSFGHYLAIAPPPGPSLRSSRQRSRQAWPSHSTASTSTTIVSSTASPG